MSVDFKHNTPQCKYSLYHGQPFIKSKPIVLRITFFRKVIKEQKVLSGIDILGGMRYLRVQGVMGLRPCFSEMTGIKELKS